MIYIRTDGNSVIATGHLVRCLCIAEALEHLGAKVCFLLSDEESKELLQNLAKTLFCRSSFSFTCKVLNTAVYDAPQKELPELICLLKNRESKDSKPALSSDPASVSRRPVLLLDSYYITPDDLSALGTVAKVAYIDDLRAFDPPVDLVINYDVIPPSKRTEYEASYTKADTRLLGGEYAPLRRQFQGHKAVLRERIEHILITCGGSDPYDFVPALVSYFLSASVPAVLHVVIGALFSKSSIDALEQLAKNHACLKLHRQVSDMASLMKQCDYAVSAAGTTLYELCALGIPSVSFSMADNQIPMAKTFARTNAIPYAGDIRPKADSDPLEAKNSSQDLVLSALLSDLTAARNSVSKRSASSQAMQQLVTGDGALKIAKALCRL